MAQGFVDIIRDILFKVRYTQRPKRHQTLSTTILITHCL